MSISNLRILRPFPSTYTTTPSIRHHQYQCHYLLSSSSTRQFSSSSIRRDINGPPSTLPPELEIPVKIPDEYRIKFLYRRGRAYLKFYKSGLWAIRDNVRDFGKFMKSLTKYDRKRGPIFEQAMNDGTLDRSKFLLIRRTQPEMLRAPLFAVIFMVLGEWTPLILMGVPSVVPVTCRLPGQVDKTRTKMEERRAKEFNGQQVKVNTHRKIATKNLLGPYASFAPTQWEGLYHGHAVHINRSLGLYSTIWDSLGVRVPSSVLYKRLAKALKHVHTDDLLILKEGGAKAIEMSMSFEEVKMALVDRAVDIMGREDKELRDVLMAWIASRKVTDVPTLLLTRPDKWPVKPKIYRTTIQTQPNESSTNRLAISKDNPTTNLESTEVKENEFIPKQETYKPLKPKRNESPKPKSISKKGQTTPKRSTPRIRAAEE